MLRSSIWYKQNCIFHDFGILDLRTTEPFRSDSRTFFSNLRTFGLKNLRTHEPSNLRTFGLIGCNRWTGVPGGDATRWTATVRPQTVQSNGHWVLSWSRLLGTVAALRNTTTDASNWSANRRNMLPNGSVARGQQCNLHTLSAVVCVPFVLWSDACGTCS